ncbi:hypothetical protein AB0J82_28985 [Asanoa sp. NPDC049518]|uniref:hypothetical protein n=1 Tax=unclassified Asanoa TaxID=2685164 RepID=UPI0034397B7A
MTVDAATHDGSPLPSDAEGGSVTLDAEPAGRRMGRGLQGLLPAGANPGKSPRTRTIPG